MTLCSALFSQSAAPWRRNSSRGFTLLELLIVVAIVAIATSGVALALRDSGQAQLESEAQRLAALLDSARAQSRSTGVPIRWRVTADGFAFDGLPPEIASQTPKTWLTSGIAANASAPLVLGPEPLVAPQKVRLWLAAQPERSVTVFTDGIRPFSVQSGVSP